MHKKTKKIILTITTLVASFSFIPLASCSSPHTVLGKNSITIFTPNQIDAAANGGYSLDSSYSAASLENTIGQTRAHTTDYSTTGSYSNYSESEGYQTRPTSVLSTTGVAERLDPTGSVDYDNPRKNIKQATIDTENNTSMITTQIDATHIIGGLTNYYLTAMKIKYNDTNSFGYATKSGAAAQGYMPKSNPSDWVLGDARITKWDYLLNFSRFWYASSNSDQIVQGNGSHGAALAQNAYYISMLGLDLAATIQYNIQHPESDWFYIVTDHASPVEGIVNKEFFGAPVSAGYIQMLLEKQRSTYSDDIYDIAKGCIKIGTNDGDPLNPTTTGYSDPASLGGFDKYIKATIDVYGKDAANYSDSVMIFSGKYYISNFTRNIVAIYRKNPFYNLINNRPNYWYDPITKQINNSITYDKITQIISNNSTAEDPTNKAYSQWRDGQINVVQPILINSNQVNDILNNYAPYVRYVGAQPTSQARNIAFNMNIWTSDGERKSNISVDYEKFVKQFFTPAAIDLRYNLMRSVNYVAIAKLINPQNPGSINNSSTPILWSTDFKDPSDPTKTIDVPLAQDKNNLGLTGGNTIAQLQSSDKNTSTTDLVNKSNWTWSQMQSSITSDLQKLGLTQLNLNYMTLENYSNVQLNAFSYYDQAWKAVSNGKISLSITPLTDATRKQVYNDLNAEIGSNFWAPDFSNGLGSWYRSFSGHSFVQPDAILGLAQTGVLAAPKGSIQLDSSSIKAVTPSQRYGFEDLAQYILNNWNLKDESGKAVTKPASAIDLQNYILSLSITNNLVDSTKYTNSNNNKIIDQVADLLTFWVNDTKDKQESYMRGYRISSWMNQTSFLLPFTNPTGYLAQNPMLVANGMNFNTPQTLDLIMDFADMYQKA